MVGSTEEVSLLTPPNTNSNSNHVMGRCFLDYKHRGALSLFKLKIDQACPKNNVWTPSRDCFPLFPSNTIQHGCPYCFHRTSSPAADTSGKAVFFRFSFPSHFGFGFPLPPPSRALCARTSSRRPSASWPSPRCPSHCCGAWPRRQTLAEVCSQHVGHKQSPGSEGIRDSPNQKRKTATCSKLQVGLLQYEHPLVALIPFKSGFIHPIPHRLWSVHGTSADRPGAGGRQPRQRALGDPAPGVQRGGRRVGPKEAGGFSPSSCRTRKRGSMKGDDVDIVFAFRLVFWEIDHSRLRQMRTELSEYEQRDLDF